MSEKNIAFCVKCCSKIVQPDMLDPRCSQLVGCKELTKDEWEEGWFADEDGITHQHNCPVMKSKAQQ